MRQQYIAHASVHSLVRTAHAIPGEMTEASHPCHGRDQVFRRHVQGHEDGIDATPVKEGVEGGWRLQMVNRSSEETIELCPAAYRGATVLHGDLL